MIFHENRLLADGSHELSYLIFFENWEKCRKICRLLQLRLGLKGLRILYLSYDVASGSEIMQCNKIDKPLVVYRFTGKVMTSITTLHK